MKARADATVLGAGLMGRLLAHALAARGMAVEVRDAGTPDAQGSAARVAAAMLAPLAESAVTEWPVVRMGVHALQRWPEILQTLPAPVFLQREGTVIVWHRQDASEARRFQALLARTAGALRELPGLEPAVELDATGLDAMEPGLGARFPRGLHLPGEGQLDNRALLQALLRSLQDAAGVQLLWEHPTDPSALPDDGRWVFDCRGLGAKAQWPGLRGVRGEVVRLHAPGVRLRRPTRLIHPRHPIYIAPKPDDLFVVGATEIETEDVSPATVRSTLELLSAAYTVDPAFGEARIVEISAQARPTLPDNLPLLEVMAPRRLRINGLYRHGFLIAPALLDATLQWMDHGASPLAASFGLRIQHDT